VRFLRTTHVVSPAGFGLGYRPDSARHDFAKARPTLVDVIKARGLARASTADNTTGTISLCGTTFNQSNTGSCTSQSSNKAFRITLAGNGQLAQILPAGIEDFSPKFFYAGTRAIERAAATPANVPLPALTDSGCEPSDCVTMAQQNGLAPLGTLIPGVYDDVDGTNVAEEMDLGQACKATFDPGAADVDITSSDLAAQWQTMVNANIGGAGALFVDTQNFMAYDGNAPVSKINLNDPQGGGHQICGPCYWYSTSSLGLIWGFLNSWGASWGKNGFVEITHTCLMTAIDAALAFNASVAAKAVAI
jgi:hypothetical protein